MSDAMARTLFEWAGGYLKTGKGYCKRLANFSRRDVLVDIHKSADSFPKNMALAVRSCVHQLSPRN